jgi:glycosyltransferase involved in cell wall biosynthesis
MTNVSVVVLSKDEPELDETLSVIESQLGSNDECVVIDASQHRLDHIRDAHPGVRWLDYQGPFWRNVTIPHQRNFGVRAAQGRVIAFCDAGEIPDPGWLQALTDPLVDGTWSATAGPIRGRSKDVLRLINDGTDGQVLAEVPTGNLAFTKAAFEAVNGFDERFDYGSDVDFTTRMANAGNPVHLVRAASMSIDWGTPKRNRKRLFLYGVAWARRFRLRPEIRPHLIKASPARPVYAAWIAGVALGWPLLFLGPLAWLYFAGVATIALPFAAHPRTPQIVRGHIIDGYGALHELVVGRFRRNVPVVFFPDDPSPYLTELRAGLERAGVSSAGAPRPTPSESLNFLFAPLSLLVLRLRGVRVLHVQWLTGFAPGMWSKPGLRRFARLWLGLWLRVARATRMAVVYTSHNMLPHEHLFDDDVAATTAVRGQAKRVISLSEATAQAGDVVIEHGPFDLDVPAVSAPNNQPVQATGSTLTDVAQFCVVGQIRAYKGVDLVLDAFERANLDARLVVAGAARPPALAHELVERKIPGVDLRLVRQSDEQFAQLLAESRFAVFGFSAITNSGSVILALSNGVPVIIPDLPELADVPASCAIRYGVGDANSLAAAMREALTADAYSMGEAGRTWAHRVSWDDIASAHVEQYRRALT